MTFSPLHLLPALLLLSPSGPAATPLGEGAEEPGAVESRSLRLLPEIGVLPDRIAVTDLLDSARVELERGRAWHAAVLLRTVDPDMEGVRELRARAEAGWGNWAAVEELLGDRSLDAAELLWLAARAAEEIGEPEEAARRYRRVTARSSGVRREAAMFRLARMEARADAWSAAAEVVAGLEAELTGERAGAVGWLRLALARWAASQGRPDEVDRLLGGLPDRFAERSWDLPGRALLEAGDTARAGRVLAENAAGRSGWRAATAWNDIAWIRARQDDREGAREARIAALRAAPGTEAAGVAAEALVGGVDDPDLLDEMSGALAATGRDQGALRTLDRLREVAPDRFGIDERFDRAALLARSGREAEAIEEFRAMDGVGSEAQQRRLLDRWWRTRRAMGRAAAAREVQSWILERHPSSPEAVDLTFFDADGEHDRGRLERAIEGYREAAERAPALDRAGLARMRWGQLLLERGRVVEAAEVFAGYLERFPNGRRRDEATYWLARTRIERGREEEAREALQALRSRDPLSYYSVLTAELLGEPFAPELPAGPEPTVPTEEQRAGFALLDLLRESGLEEGTEAVAEDLFRAARAGSDREAEAAARAFMERGYTIRGINLGWDLRSRGRSWDRELLGIIYPLPQRELVEAEAAEVGLDPWLVMAVIRQESAFQPEAVSRAGAHGLMQVVPSTGRQLARSVGPDPFERESLFRPEINLHLGTRFLAEMLERYDGRLDLALAAYNAGPTRANRWRLFPEAADPLRFVERIPFGETRDYVKKVTRNRGVYSWLYGR